MTFDVNQLEKYRVLKNDTTATSKVLETQKYNFLEGIESEILKLIDQDEFICIDNNIEDLKSVSSDTIEKINNNVELKKYILTYLFWKYKGTKNNIKKAFGIKHGEQLEDCIYHIKYKKTCPLCGGYGEVSLESSSRKRKTFICNSCGHTDQTFDEKYKNRDSYLYCECNYCRDVREKLRKCYSDWILENLKECENIIKELPIYMDKVDDKTMKRHAKIQSSNLCSDSREILAYEPTSIEELEVIKKDIAELSR